MKIFGLVFLSVVVTLVGTNESKSQDLFGGHGIRPSGGGQETPQKASSRWPNLLDFSTDKKPDMGRFQLFRSKPGSDGAKTTWFRKPEMGANGLWANMPTIFPKRDPNTPGFFEQVNTKSRDIVGRTSDWAQRQNHNLRSKTFDSWDAITKDLRIPQRGASQSTEGFEYGMKPPVRSADGLENKPKVRF